jgi:type IV pilus assembly protein PilY1
MKTYIPKTLLRLALAQTIATISMLPPLVSTAQAATTAISDQPLLTISSVRPNIMYTLDNSGSMEWSTVTGTDATAEYTDGSRNRRAYFSSAYNQIYYDPTITYTPGISYNGTSMGNASTSATRIDAYPTQGGSTATAPLNNTCYAKSTPIVPTFDPGNYSDITGSTAVANCRTNSGSTYNNNVARFAFYYTWGGSGTPTGVSGEESSYTRIDILSGSTYPRAATRTDCAANPCTYGEELQNFANWFSYYRTRILMTKTALGISFSHIDPITSPVTTPKFRVGFNTINAISSSGNVTYNNGHVTDGNDWLTIRNFDSTQRQTFYTTLYKVNPAQGTPLRSQMNRIGKLYQHTLSGAADPVQYSCQQNYHIMSTDGFWNDALSDWGGGLPSGETNPDGNASNPYATRLDGTIDGLGATNALADVAMYFYKTDLRTGVAASAACTGATDDAGLTHDVCENTVPPNNKDTAPFQHMTTFTIGLGASGTKTFRDDYVAAADSTNAAYDATSFFAKVKANTDNWPSPPAAGDDPKTIDDLWHAAVNGRGTYLNATNPTLLANGLTEILNDIAARGGAASGASVASPVLTATNNHVYSVSYRTSEWTGELNSKTITYNPTTQQTTLSTPVWQSQSLLDTKVAGTGWNTGRIIVTSSGGTGVPFRLASLSAAQKATLGSTSTSQQSVLNFLRGDASNEGAAPGQFRIRIHTLGDIVGSEAVVVVAPNAVYDDTNNPGYSAFKTSTSSRPARLYVGANDGMLHVFDEATGQETWAYVPSLLMRGTPPPAASPTADGLVALSYQDGGSPPSNHHYYVDATPSVTDVDFNKTYGACPTPPCTSDWRTILVGGLNKGGKGFYALDITSPASITSEATAAAKILWEFDGTPKAGDLVTVSPTEMGYSFGRPTIAKTRAFGWVVIVSSGYNNADGLGYLYVLNAKTGNVLFKFSTGVGAATTPSGLARFIGYTANYTDRTLEQLYGGDLYGRLWRFDVSPASVASWSTTPTLLFQTPTVSGAVQPITTTPQIAIDPRTPGIVRWIFVGTGRFLDTSDDTTTQVQSFYAMVDGTKSVPATTGLPYARTQLTQITGVGTQSPVLVDSTHHGWYQDLVGTGERINIDPAVDQAAGTVAWSGSLPSTDACAPGAEGNSYARDIVSGYSRLVDLTDPANPVPIDHVHIGVALVKNQIVNLQGVAVSPPPGPPGPAVAPVCRGNQLLVTNAAGIVNTLGYCGGAAGITRINWREIFD